MTIKKYSARPGYFPSIEVIDVDRETETYVWLEGMRVQKTTKYEAFTETFEDAKKYLVLQAGEQLLAAYEAYVRTKTALDRAVELKEPA